MCGSDVPGDLRADNDNSGFAGLDIDEWPHVKAWQDRMMQRPAVQKGVDVPTKVDLERLASDPEAFKAYLANNTIWIRHGMEQDAKV